ncbi:ankyrin [Gonapodya prolifera JEL478]|uniref:Ankyrin n=1 Tax=Gonapodya prolifera (strain JEL478) TaxID=1344416 RepID=A0A139A8B8_GONPJ|nr:ankyrin [Gonapodya prolifera JEL478]|eukprot:KXS12928.1 ankyrin [Gonapodya prolifera JEL478]
MWKYVLADLQALDAQLLAGTFGTLWNNRGSRDGFMPKRNFCSELANGAGGLDSELNQSSPTYWAITTGNVSALRILIRNGLGGLSPVVLLTRMEKEKREEAFSKAGVTGGESVASDPAPAGDKFYRKLKLTWGPSKKAHDEDHEDDSGDDDFFSTWSPVKASPCHVAALQGRNSLLNYLLSDELDKDVDVFTSSYPDDPRSVAFRTRPQERELFIQVVLRGQAHPHYGDQTVAHYTAVGRNPDGLRAYMRWVSHTFGEDKARTYVNTRNRDGITPLHFAASRGYDEMVEALLEVGAECSEMDYARGWNAAHFASYHGKVGSLTQFISKLDKEKAIKLVCQPSRVFKHTPLMVATSQGHHRVVDLLTKFTSSATTNRDFMSRSALDLAVRGSYVDTVKRLLANGTLVQDSLSHEDVVGLTPFGAASHILRGKVRAGEFSELLPKKQPVPVEWPSRKPLRPVNDDDEEKIEIDAVEVYRVLTAIQPAASSRKPSELEEVHASMQASLPGVWNNSAFD